MSKPRKHAKTSSTYLYQKGVLLNLSELDIFFSQWSIQLFANNIGPPIGSPFVEDKTYFENKNSFDKYKFQINQ